MGKKWKDQPTEDDLIETEEELNEHPLEELEEEDIDDPWMDDDVIDEEKVRTWHNYVEGE